MKIKYIMGGKIWLFIEILTAASMGLVVVLKYGYDYFRPKTKKSLKGKVVVLTNCSQPLVASLAKQLAVKHKCHIFCADGNQDVLTDLVKEIRVKDDSLIVNSFTWSGVSDDADRLCMQVSQLYKNIDMLISGEGLEKPKILKQPQDIKESIDRINEDLLTHFKLPLAFLPSMLGRDEGHMVSISSCTQERHSEETKSSRLRGRNGENTETLFNNLYQQNFKVRHTRVQTTSEKYFEQKKGDAVEKMAAEIIDGIRLNKRHVRTPGLKVRVKSYIASGLRAVSQFTISDTAS